MNEKHTVQDVSDAVLLNEVKRRFDQKNATLDEMKFLTKKLYDLNEKLKETDSIKGAFLSLIKNVFNNPVSSLLNLSAMMQKNEDSPKTQTIKHLLEMELRKLDFQLNNIFTAAEIEAGEIANYWCEVDVRRLIDEVCESFAYLMRDKSLNLVIEIYIEEPIITDAKKLHTICMNLISNACEYSYRHHNVKIKVWAENKLLHLSIANTGDVIAKEFKKEIFSRFKKINSPSCAREGLDGLGLGLSVVNALVESLDGEIDYVSSKEETRFNVSIPLQDVTMAEASMSESANEFIFDDTDMKEF
jgi:signal transduction histidine kinase